MTCADAKRLFPDCWQAVLEAEAAWGPEVWQRAVEDGDDIDRVLWCMRAQCSSVCTFRRNRWCSALPTHENQMGTPGFRRYIGGKLGLC